MTSEQSMSVLWSTPRRPRRPKTSGNVSSNFSWSFVNDCHSHAVRESRARRWSDCRRISPRRGEVTVPWTPPWPGKVWPRSCVSRKNWVSKISGVESKGVPGIDGSTWSAAAMVCLRIPSAKLPLLQEDAGLTHEARRATTSAGLKFPASLKRWRMLSTVSNGSGTVPSGAGAVGAGRPSKNSRRGAPGQLLTPTAPANWMLLQLSVRV